MAKKPSDGKTPKRAKSALLPAVIVAVAIGGGSYFFGGRAGPPVASAAPAPPPPVVTATEPPEEGPVVAIDPITLNLAGGSYLKVGMALQFVAPEGEGEGEKEPPEGATAKASDIAVELLSRHTMEELSAPEPRAAVKEELVTQIREAYHDEVTDVYFTEFVMQ